MKADDMRELDPVSARSLAQAALADEDLFDTLVARGAVESALDDPSFHFPTPARRRSSRPWTIAIAGMGAVAAGLITFFVLRPSVSVPVHRTLVMAKPRLQAQPGPTILLTVDLQKPGASGSPIFRGDEAASRAPKSEGTVVLIEDGVATVNLGSLDGIAKGQQIGPITITTVFRDRARGTIAGGAAIHVHDPVRVPNTTHLQAILEQVNALAAGGNLTAARDMARTNIAGSAGETRPLLERLAALDYQAGAADAARERYEVAVNNFDQTPAAAAAERVTTLANYGALAVMHGDAQLARDLLQTALPLASDPALRSEILSNLGALAAMRLDDATAAEYYRQALAQKSSGTDRALIEANLASLNRTPRRSDRQ
jgi:tetratricopeptide (TPR) repeat protein